MSLSGPAGRNTAQFPIAGRVRGAMPCNWPRTKELKRRLTFWPAPLLKAALKARPRNERSDAHNYKTVLFSSIVHARAAKRNRLPACSAAEAIDRELY
jgi:hypothetical protein